MLQKKKHVTEKKRSFNDFKIFKSLFSCRLIKIERRKIKFLNHKTNSRQKNRQLASNNVK